MKTTAFVLALLTSEASAISIDRPHQDELLEYRPHTDGRTPWYKAVPKKEADPDYPINYSVPSYGADQDIAATQNSQATAEKQVGHKLQATFEKPKGFKKDYVVPNFGADHDLITLNKNLENAEKAAGHKIDAASFTTKPKYPVDYDVSYQNLGRDKDVIATEKHAQLAEKQLNHVWSNMKAKADAAIPKNYFVPDFGVDQDIKTTANNLKNAEQTLGKKWTLAQSKESPDQFEWAQSESDLRLTSEVSIAEAMQRVGQDYHSYGAFAQTGDDQICPSSGCPENPIKAAEEAKVITYKTGVPLDDEIGTTIRNEKYAANYHDERSSYEAERFGKFVPVGGV